MSIKTIFFVLFLILTLDAKERIIALSPGITEILFALGAGDDVVGVSSFSLYPEAAKAIPVVGNYTSPTLEKILALKPSLIIAQDFSTRSIQDLKTFHIPTLIVSLQSINAIKSTIMTLGTKLDHVSNALALVQEIDNSIAQAKHSNNPHSVLIVFGLQEDLRNGIYVAGHDIFFEEIITLSGNTNAYTGSLSAQPVLSYENVIALNPEQIIILHSHESAPHVDVKKAVQNWYQLPTRASKKGRISVIEEEFIHIPSHRIAQSIKRLSQEMRDD
jgi:iron complex transport system substrate-binding protein